jgi:hypothetical protein
MSTMGFNLNVPKEVVFHPKALAGVGISHLCVEQGTHQVLGGMLRHHRDSESSVGTVLTVAIQWYQLVVGARLEQVLPHQVGEYFKYFWLSLGARST